MSLNFHIYFGHGAADLARAERALDEAGLDVERSGDRLRIGGGERPEFGLVVWSGPSVAAEAREIAARHAPDSAEASALLQCAARFEVWFEDAEEVFDEINTLIEIQTALQDETAGVVFMPWNGNVSLPETN
ncbi:hypothetical protein [Lysobacter enzymogenes]|uniref:hypothetical protein n=1 Tax=Lysobacter enzymogenes TaxID=69 RepID=UPI001A9648F9|nr:hypothetical protein [Lysobacter enzymogenes]QQP95775.1 hypothetical protein JHW38_21515 [Lysobacter enzymogenes]